MPTSVKVIRCSCGWMGNADEQHPSRWVKTPDRYGKLIDQVVCPGTPRKEACGALLTPETIEFKGLKALRSRKSRRQSIS